MTEKELILSAWVQSLRAVTMPVEVMAARIPFRVGWQSAAALLDMRPEAPE